MDDVQGAGTVDLLGDTILVLDPTSTGLDWDSFDHMDPAGGRCSTRRARTGVAGVLDLL